MIVMICMLYVLEGGQGLLSRALFIVCLLMIVFFPFLSVPVLFDVGYVHFIV